MDTTALEQHYKITGLNIWRMNPQGCLDTLPGGNPQGVAVTGALRTAMNQQFKELEHKDQYFWQTIGREVPLCWWGQDDGFPLAEAPSQKEAHCLLTRMRVGRDSACTGA